MPAVWYNDPVSQKRYVKLTGTWNLCWRAKFLEGLAGSLYFLISLLHQAVLLRNATAENGGRP